MLIGLDFDDTVVKNAFPDIGEPLPGALETLRELVKRGHHLILWTCRENEKKRQYLDEAVRFLENNGVKLRSVNCNLPEDDFRDPKYPNRKIYAQVYIDDRNFGCGRKINWDSIAKEFDIGWKKVKFWIKSNRGTDDSEIIKVKEKATEKQIKEQLEEWCEQFCAWDHGDNMIQYGWEEIKDKKE